MLDVGNYFAYRYSSDPMPTRMDTFSQFGQRRGLQSSAYQHLSVYMRCRCITAHGDILTNLLWGFLRKTGQCLKPHHLTPSGDIPIDLTGRRLHSTFESNNQVEEEA